MFERFTDRARKVMALANQEAQRLNHEYIGTEHILLGLIKEGSGIGAHVFKNLDTDFEKIRTDVEALIKGAPDIVTMGKLPQTPLAKKVIEHAILEARLLNHNYVGTEHLLLGLIREYDGVASRVLRDHGLTLEAARSEVVKLLGTAAMSAAPAEAPAGLRPKGAETTVAMEKVIIGAADLAKAGSLKELGAEMGRLLASGQLQPGPELEEYLRKRMPEAELSRKLWGTDYPPCTTGHLLLSILSHPTSQAARSLAAVGVDFERLRGAVEDMIRQDPHERA